MAFLIPYVLITHQISFITSLDTATHYIGGFTLLSNLYHGGIQLWNPYDQMPLAFHHLTGTIYNFGNITTALAYVVLSPYVSFPGELFHAIFSVTFFVCALFIRVAGIYLLLSRFCPSRAVLFFATVYGAVVLQPDLLAGFGVAELYSFFPLLTHFILNFFERFRLKDFLLSLGVMAIAIFDFNLTALEYFYQGIHFLILVCMVWAIAKNWKNHRRLFPAGGIFAQWLKAEFNPRNLYKIAFVLFFCAVLLLPNIYMLLANYQDYDVAHETSRMKNPLSIKAYFSRAFEVAPQKEFLWRMVDFYNNRWDSSWLFLGFVLIFLVLSGIILSLEDRKYIFMAVAILFWMLNHPRQMISWGSLAHWINALTNPLKFLPRSSGMTGVFLLSFVLLPLATMGMQSLYDLWVRKSTPPAKTLRLALLALSLTGLVVLNFSKVSHPAQWYLLGESAVIFLIIRFLWSPLSPTPNGHVVKGLGIGLFLALMIPEILAMRFYIANCWDNNVVSPRLVKGLEKRGFIGVDYQNPEILPRRDYYNNFLVQSPGGAIRNAFLVKTPLNMPGLFYRYTNLRKQFGPPENHFPRHRMFSELASDRSLQEYVLRDTVMYFFTDQAVASGEGVLEEILKEHRERGVVMAEGIFPNESTTLGGLTENREPLKKRQVFLTKVDLPLEASKISIRDKLVYYAFELPEDFPDHLSTGIFSIDQLLFQVHMGQRALKPVQGQFVRPGTFDLQNVSTRQLIVAVSLDDIPQDPGFTFYYLPGGSANLGKIWKNQPDNFGFDYTAPQDGWLVLHFPYDKKWQATLDGQGVPIHRVNKIFMGLALKQGEHKILLRYWPGTLLRPLIGLSLVLFVGGIFLVMGVGWHEENLRRVSSQ